MCTGIIIISGILGLADAYPALFYDYYKMNARGIQNIGESENYQAFSGNPCLRSHRGDVKCHFYNEVEETIPEIDDYSAVLSENPMELDASQLERDYIQEQSAIEQNEADAETLTQNQNIDLYNYKNFPIHTYIHGLVPQYSPTYYEDMYPALNLMPFNRLTRRASTYEELLAQLSHDAQMNNILPTMSVRTVGPPYYGPYNGPVRASFPQTVGGCSTPLLFGCKPIIHQGVLKKGYVYPPSVNVLLPTPTSYKESMLNQKVMRSLEVPNEHRSGNVIPTLST